ncbi:hypothetical protein AB1K54_08145 [Microbacterium sp. BWT-B31]|uniref:hypothetical protein n=1 Tax=Microbacterium sp. BWT-B31 TaxID=3232072 RepID=UPI003528DFD6
MTGGVVAIDRGEDLDAEVVIEYCGEWFPVDPAVPFTVGREADLSVDDNPFLHRRLLEISRRDDFWMLHNVGTRLAVTVTDGRGRLQSWLAPGGRLPLVFGRTSVVFTAGPTTYEFAILVAEPAFSETHPASLEGTTTIGDVTLTESQRLLILALAEPMLLRDGSGLGEIPTSARAAARLGWATTRFNRKLDNVCEKFARIGVQGLRGGADSYATNRRIRLVEYAIAARVVTRADLALLDDEAARWA